MRITCKETDRCKKKPKLKSINMANNYTENKYNSRLLRIRSPQPKRGKLVYFFEGGWGWGGGRYIISIQFL